MNFRCTGPNPHGHLLGADPTNVSREWEFDPAIADCGYRGPLTLRLARQNSNKLIMAEREGFEPSRQVLSHLPDFQSSAFSQLSHLSALIKLAAFNIVQQKIQFVILKMIPYLGKNYILNLSQLL